MILGIVNGIKRKGVCMTGRPAVRSLLLIAVCASGGCGFQLAGSGTLPPGMAATVVDSAEPRSEFSASLRDALRRRGLDLVDAGAPAAARLIVSEDASGQRVLSVTARNIPREYEVFYRVTFALEIDGRALIEPEPLVARRAYTYDETRVLGKAREESQLRRALAEDLVRQVMRRIEAVAASGALAST